MKRILPRKFFLKGRGLFQLLVLIAFSVFFTVLSSRYKQYSYLAQKNVSSAAREAPSIRVVKIVDGDTLKLANGERLRLIGIDCPESRVNDKAMRDSKKTGKDLSAIIRQGKLATDFVKSLEVEGALVRLAFDVQQRDKYGRLLAYVYKKVCDDPCPISLPKDQEYITFKDGTYLFLNATLLKSGYASPMTIPPNAKYADHFVRLYKQARGTGRGLWNN